MSFGDVNFDNRQAPEMVEFILGSKKRKAAKTYAVGNTIAKLADTQKMSNANQLTAILSSDGKVNHKDRKLIRKAVRQDTGTQRREDKQDRKKQVGISQAENVRPSETSPVEPVTTNVKNGINAMESPTKQAENPLASMLSGGGGGGGDVSQTEKENEPTETKKDNDTNNEKSKRPGILVVALVVVVAVVLLLTFKSKK